MIVLVPDLRNACMEAGVRVVCIVYCVLCAVCCIHSSAKRELVNV